MSAPRAASDAVRFAINGRTGSVTSSYHPASGKPLASKITATSNSRTLLFSSRTLEKWPKSPTEKLVDPLFFIDGGFAAPSAALPFLFAFLRNAQVMDDGKPQLLAGYRPQIFQGAAHHNQAAKNRHEGRNSA